MDRKKFEVLRKESLLLISGRELTDYQKNLLPVIISVQPGVQTFPAFPMQQ